MSYIYSSFVKANGWLDKPNDRRERTDGFRTRLAIVLRATA
jgi:hypothetical protein